MNKWTITDLHKRGFISKEACTRALALRGRSSARYETRRSECWGEQARLDEESLVDHMVTPSQIQQTSQEIIFDPEEVISQAHESTQIHQGESNCDAQQLRMVDGLYYTRIPCWDPDSNYSQGIDPETSDAIVSLASELIKKNLTVGLITYKPPYFHQNIEDRLRNLPHELALSGFMDFGWNEERRSKQLDLCLYASGILYGGLHALAWSATFRTPIERLIWRISSITVIASMPVVDCSTILVSRAEDRAIELVAFLLYLMRFLCVVFYFFARAYLVVECFIALAHSPIGVYEVPQWSNYVPHIG